MPHKSRKKNSPARSVKMKKTRGWAVVYRTGEVWFVHLKEEEARESYRAYHVDGNIRIAHVEIRELPTPKRKK